MQKNNSFQSALVLIAVEIFAPKSATANVRLPRLVADNMVLQRDSKLSLWGWVDSGENVTVQFHGQRVTTKPDKHGRWSTTMGPFTAGGPYEMLIKGKNTIELKNVMVGDVWLASGQSNMEFTLGPSIEDDTPGVLNAEHEAAGAKFPSIRLFRVHHQFALTPKEDVETEGWSEVTPKSVGNFSAVGYFFGRELHRRYHVPIGIIESSWGGTVAEAWVGESALKNFPEFQDSIRSLKQIDEKSAAEDYSRYVSLKSTWEQQNATVDRGRVDGHDIWAATDFNASSWPTIMEPQVKAEEAFKGFDGVIWFRKEIDVSAKGAGKDLNLHLTHAYESDTTFFNGTQIGETHGGDKPKDYLVPGNLVKSGRNVITVRLTGKNGFVGFFSDNARDFNAESAGQVIPLAGPWSYQPGPELAGLPKQSAFAKFHSDPNTATLLFNGMVAPLAHFKIKGVIWYQGESNAIDHRSAQYRSLFPTLIEDWRKQWGYPFPFLFVQLAGWPPMSNGAEPGDSPFAELREAQSMALALPGTGMATAVDQPEDHPRDKQTVAHRLALVAAKVVYGENIVATGPTYQSMEVESGRIRIRYSNLGSGLTIRDKYGYARGFEIAAANGKFVWAQARQDGTDILVFNESIPHPVSVRYDWSDTPDGNLYNVEGLPATPFRTDAPKNLNASR